MNKTTSTIALAAGAAPATKSPTKLDRLTALLQEPAGATMAEMTAATGWQPHSVRGAMAGSLRKKGHAIESAVIERVRRWRITGAAK